MLIKMEFNQGGEPSFIFYANIVIILQITKSAIILYAAQWRFGEDRKYHMRPIDNIISLEQFTQMREEPHFLRPQPLVDRLYQPGRTVDMPGSYDHK